MARRKAAGGLDILDDVIDMTVDSLVSKARDAFHTARATRPADTQVYVCAGCGKFAPSSEFQFLPRTGTQGLCVPCAAFSLQAASEKLKFLTKRAAAAPPRQPSPQPSKPAAPPPWQVLGIDVHASEEEIKKAYRKIVMEWHPDRLPPEQREEAQRRIDEATKARDAMMRVRKAPE